MPALLQARNRSEFCFLAVALAGYHSPAKARPFLEIVCWMSFRDAICGLYHLLSLSCDWCHCDVV
jgi:hypothetical protein